MIFWSCYTIGAIVSVSWQKMASLHSLGQYDSYYVQHDFSCHVMPLALVLASYDAVSILNVTITPLGQDIQN